MSYNVSDWSIKKLDGFTLPFAKVLEMAEGDLNDKDGILTFDRFYASGMEITGTREGDRLNVSDIRYGGEGSGGEWGNFEDLLTKSTGTLRARVV